MRFFSNSVPGAKNPHMKIKFVLSEYCHVAYQIKAAYNNILANVVLFTYTQKADLFSFLKIAMLHNQSK